MTTAKELTRLKDRIETLKTKKAEAEGMVKAGMQRLQDEFKCKTIPAAKKRIAALDKQIEDEDAAIAEQTAELEEAIREFE